MAALFLIGSAAVIPILFYTLSDSVSTSYFTSPAFFYALTFILGCSFPTLLSQIGSRIARYLDGPGTSERDAESRSNSVKFSKNDDSLYGLDHAILNVPSLEARTMWMNMGYWRVSSGTLCLYAGLVAVFPLFRLRYQLEEKTRYADCLRNLATASCTDCYQ